MGVFGDIEAYDVTVGAARRDDPDLAFERHEGLKDRRLGRKFIPDGVEVVTAADYDLALAVIAETSGLQHGGQPELRHRLAYVGGRCDVGIVSRGDPQAPDEVLLDQAVLRRLQDL